MMHAARPLLFAFSCIALISACTKPVTIGSDFLDDEKSGLHFADDFDLTFFTEATDSILTHNGSTGQQLSPYLLGNIEELIFGRYTAEIYAQPVIATIATQLLEGVLDSVVLQLRYDSDVHYGELTSPVTIEVFKMLENPPFETKIYSNQRFMSDTNELLGSATFIPAPNDSVTVITGDDTARVAPHIRIALDKLKFGDFMTQDTTVYENLDTFLNFFNGLHIRMTGVTNTMLGLDLLSTVSGLTLYYDKGTSEDLNFKFLFTSGAVKHVYMEHDYLGSTVGSTLSPDPENELWYVQGLSGVTTAMHVDGLDALGNAVINNAELEFYCSFPDGDVPEFYPPIPYLVTQEKTDTSLVRSIDVQFALAETSGAYINSSTYEILFGGSLTDTLTGPPVVYRYNMRVTNQIKEIYKGSKENIIYFNPILKGNIPNRSVLFGPNHPTLAPRLRIYYTAL